MPQELDDNFLNHANDVKLKAEEKFNLGKAVLDKKLEDNKNKGLTNTSIATMIVIGFIILLTTILLYAADFSSGNINNMFNLFKVGVSVIMLILSMLGYVLFGHQGILSYRASVKCRDKNKEKVKEVNKIIDKAHFKGHRKQINHRNKINKLRDLIDYNLRERYGVKKLGFTIKDKIQGITKKWMRIEVQLNSYLKWLKITDDKSKEAKELKIKMGNFNINNFDIEHREWKDGYFVSGSSSTTRSDNSSLDNNTIKHVTINKSRTKILIWVFVTIVTSFSITSFATLDTRDKWGLLLQILFVSMTCLSGYKDSYETEEEEDEYSKDLQINFVSEYNEEYEKIKDELKEKEKKVLDNAHYYAIEENKQRDKGIVQGKLNTEGHIEINPKGTEIIDLRDYCKDCLKLSKMCSGYAETDYKAPQTCDKRETNGGKVVKKDVRPLTFLERQKLESEK